MMSASLTIRNGLLLALVMVGLTACGGDNDDYCGAKQQWPASNVIDV